MTTRHTHPIAIVGIGAHYPDAPDPDALWEMIITGRRAFRRIPSERLVLSDYAGNGPDSTYLTHAALLERFEFDRTAYRVVGSTFRSVDIAHWLALDTAAATLHDAGFPEGVGIERSRMGVIVGNTLTGETSRAQSLRLRFPYVARTVDKVLRHEGRSDKERAQFLKHFEELFKKPFEEPNEETLAGGLSNTISGRICNQFDLGGGGFNVDGACSSSLLAVVQGCSALASGTLDSVLVGGVDVSLDPFELVGFARVGAIAHELMRVYDANPTGFWPGEGCGFALLMREEDALARGLRVYATLRGWGISSDGKGGLTRPTEDGERRALADTYRGAGFEIDQVGYIEGHGTGTAVGDDIELSVFDASRQEAARAAGRTRQRACIGSVKANLGHTKAAAGIAGLLKAVLAVDRGVLPPTTGCRDPHPRLLQTDSSLQVADTAQPWEGDVRRAAVSSTGFGGINVHVAIEKRGGARSPLRSMTPTAANATHQDAELFLFAAPNLEALLAEIDALAAVARQLSFAELTDVSVRQASAVAKIRQRTHRAAIVAADPDELHTKLAQLRQHLVGEAPLPRGVFHASGAPRRVGVLFPGQGAGIPHRAALEGRYPRVAQLLGSAPNTSKEAATAFSTDILQPAVVASSLAALTLLEEAGLQTTGAVGHSLGELCAMSWAGVLPAAETLELAGQRGAIFEHSGGADTPSDSRRKDPGGMLLLQVDRHRSEALLRAATSDLVIAAENGDEATVVSGRSSSIDKLQSWLADNDPTVRSQSLKVSHAFHSPCMCDAVKPFAEVVEKLLDQHPPSNPRPGWFSTVTGEPFVAGESVASSVTTLLTRQVLERVRFREAIDQLATTCDAFLELGPGSGMSQLAHAQTGQPSISIDLGSPSLLAWWTALGQVFTWGVLPHPELLLCDRFTREFTQPWKFIGNPCGLQANDSAEVAAEGDGDAPFTHDSSIEVSGDSSEEQLTPSAVGLSAPGTTPLQVLTQLVAQRTELPSQTIHPEQRFLDDLHMNSIAVGSIITEACALLGVATPIAPNEFATTSLGEAAAALEQLSDVGEESPRVPRAVENWVRTFCVEQVSVEEAWADEKAHDAPPIRWRTFGNAPVAVAPQGTQEGCETGVLLVLDGTAETSPQQLEALIAASEAADRQCQHVMLLQRTVGDEQGDGEEGHHKEARHSGAHLHGAHLNDARLNDAHRKETDQEGVAPWFRTLKLERPWLSITILRGDIEDLTDGDLHQQALLTQRSPSQFRERTLQNGQAFEPRLCVAPKAPATPRHSDDPQFSLTPSGDDRWLVVGGGYGIAAECALAAARQFGGEWTLVGRSREDENPDIGATLERFCAAGIDARYLSLDITDRDAVTERIAQLVSTRGPITGVIYGAGINQPALIEQLDAPRVLRTLAPKGRALRHLLDRVATTTRHLVSFGSIIGRTGLQGEADYALANAELRAVTEAHAVEHPHCRALCLEWSVWSGVGMGERLGRIDALARDGIQAITPEQGIKAFLELLQHNEGSWVISSRLGELPTLPIQSKQRELPMLRFLERPRWHHPGIEFVVEADVSVETDPYLDHHRVEGECWFPGVVGLEGMAQAAAVLLGDVSDDLSGTAVIPCEMHDVQFRERLIIPDSGATLQFAAVLRDDPGTRPRVQVVLRSSTTQYVVDHFSAMFASAEPHHPQGPEFKGSASDAAPDPRMTSLEAPTGPLRLEAEELYGSILFQRGLFRRLRGYSELFARRCAALLTAATSDRWFHGYYSQRLLLGDLGARDAVLHALQSCVPDGTLLPRGVKAWRRYPATESNSPDGEQPHRMVAQEIAQRGDDYYYDIAVFNHTGQRIEEWHQAHFTRVRGFHGGSAWSPFLVGPFLERWLQHETDSDRLPSCKGLESTGEGVNHPRIVVENHTPDRQLRRSRSLQRLLGESSAVTHRSDGKPCCADGAVSLSHDDPLTLGIATAGERSLGCDVQRVETRSADAWRQLLGEERWLLAQSIAQRLAADAVADSQNASTLDIASTIVWSALECAKKSGHSIIDVPSLGEAKRDRFRLRLGGAQIAGWIGRLLHAAAESAASTSADPTLWIAAVIHETPEVHRA